MTSFGRLNLCWVLLLAFFWGVVLWHLPASRQAPDLAAVFRFELAADAAPMETVWRYTGPRPAEGEVLRLFYRQAPPFTDRDNVRPIAYLGNEKEPSGEQHRLPEFKNEPAFLGYQHVDTGYWREGAELWIGLASLHHSRQWIENGPSPLEHVASKPFRRFDTKLDFRHPNVLYFSSISPRIVPAGAPAPEPSAPFIVLGWFAAIAFLPAIFLCATRLHWCAGAVFYTVLLYKSFEVLFPAQELWGGFHHARIGERIFWIGLAALQLLTIPWVARWLLHAPRALIQRSHDAAHLIIAAAAVAFLAPLSWWLFIQYQSLGIYGDGFGALAWPGYDYHNPFATALYHAWQDLINWLEQGHTISHSHFFPPFRLVPLFVALWAPIYILCAGWLACMLATSSRQIMPFLAVLLLIKPILTLIGYLEAYGPALAVHLLFACLLVRAFRGGGILLPTAFSFFAYLFHMAGAMVIPGVIALWLHKLLAAQNRVSWFIPRAATAILLALLIWLACLAMLYVYKHDSNWESFSRHVPATELEIGGSIRTIHGLPMLYGSTGRPKSEIFLQPSEPHFTHLYPLFSWEHASQIGGEIIFLGGPILPWLLLLILVALRRPRRDAEQWGIALTAMSFALTSLVLATSFPYPKDWDVFSINALWWTIALLWLIARGRMVPPGLRRWMLLALLAYLLWDTAPWIYYNLAWGPPAYNRNFVFY